MSPARRPVGSGIDVWHTHRLRPLAIPLGKRPMSGHASRMLIALTLPFLISTRALADDFSGADTAWMLTSTALVLFMTIPGLSLFYAGLVLSLIHI